MLLESARRLVGRVVLTAERWTAPEPPVRSPGEQADLDARTGDLALYQFTACPYCVRVRRAIRRLGLNIELRDARRNSGWAQELRREGGRYQVPCLRFENAAGEVHWLYESRDIVAWLERHFA